MFITNTAKEKYLHMVDVEKLPISYSDKKEVKLFGKTVLVGLNEWSWHLHLKLTDNCNGKCYFCVEQNSHCLENAEIYIWQVDKMLSEMESAGILFSVSLTGGESFLFKEFSELLKVLKKHDIKFLTINTNSKYLEQHINDIDGIFDFVNISRHSIDDNKNNEIFQDIMPTVEDLKRLKEKLKHTKMRIQCVICDIKSIDDMLRFVDCFSFADDIAFRKLMTLSNRHGVIYDDKFELYNTFIEYAYNNFEFLEQTIQDYYVYENWKYNGIPVQFSYSNMNYVFNAEKNEPENLCREFIIHPNGIISGSWDYKNKIISLPYGKVVEKCY